MTSAKVIMYHNETDAEKVVFTCMSIKDALGICLHLNGLVAEAARITGKAAKIFYRVSFGSN